MHILIVDDQPLFADALRQVFLRLGNHNIIHTVENTAKAMDYIEKNPNYDLIVVDINLPGLDGLGLLRQLQKHFVSIPMVMIAASNEPTLMRQALEQGASAYVPKSINAKGLLHTAHQVLSGNIYFPDLAQPVQSDAAFTLAKTLKISERQLEILNLIANGLSNKEIARELEITESTVKTHVSKLMVNLVVNNRTSCVIEAKRLGLL